MAQLPDRLGRYRVESIVGKGAMGTVYRGYDPKIDRTVALKTFNLQAFAEDEQKQLVERFHQEAQIAGRLSHPNIVTIFDVGENFIAMEFLEGLSLHEELKRKGSLDLLEVLRILKAMAAALDHAHRHQVIHRDIKPANILLVGPEKLVKLTDFGIAKLIDGKMTATGMVLGTPFYMSPEQVTGKRVDYRSDLFSLAVLTYEMITGQTPFPGDSITTVAYKIVHEAPPSTTHFSSQLPAAIDQVMAIALAKDPEQRFPNAESFANELQIAFNQQQAPSPSMEMTELMPALEDKTPIQPPIHEAQAPMRPSSQKKVSQVWFFLGAAIVLAICGWILFKPKTIQSPDMLKQSGADTINESIETDSQINLGIHESNSSELDDADRAQNQAATFSSGDTVLEAASQSTLLESEQDASKPAADRKTEPNSEPAHKKVTKAVTRPVEHTTDRVVPARPKPPSKFLNYLAKDIGHIQGMVLVNDRMHIANKSSETVEIWDSSFAKKLSSFDLPDEPGSIGIDSRGRILVPDPGDSVIRMYDSGGKLVSSFGKKGVLDLDFDGCRAVIADKHDNFWIADTENDRVVQCDAKGQLLKVIEDIKRPASIAFDERGNLIITESGKHRVICINQSGKRWWVLGEKGSGQSEFDEPQAAISGDGFLFVADTGNHRIQIFDLVTRKWLFQLESGDSQQIKSPKGLAYRQGRLYVGTSKGYVLVFSP